MSGFRLALPGAEGTELIVLRHGETDWNKERRIQGQTDIPLNARGRQQAEAAATRLSERAADYRLSAEAGRESPRLVSSDLLRCRQTAEPIARARDLAVEWVPGWRERHYGVFQGLTRHDIRREHAELHSRWQAREPDFSLPGGESLRAFHARVASALTDLLTRHAGRTVVLVTHGGVLDILYLMARDWPIEAARDVEVPNASLNRLRLVDGRLSVVQWGDVSHWDTLGEPALPST